MTTVAEIVAAIAELDLADVPAVMLALAARMAQNPRAKNDLAQRDRALTAQQVAERLNMTAGWVRENSTGWLKPARLEVGGAIRYSELTLEQLIRKRRGE